MCESSVIEYLEDMMKSEEEKLNKYLRDLSQLSHKVTNGKNEDMQKTEYEIHCAKSTIKKYAKSMNENNSLFSMVSVDWIESSIYLQQKLTKCKKENNLLQDKLSNVKINTMQNTKKDMIKLQKQCRDLRQKNKKLENALKEKQNFISCNDKIQMKLSSANKENDCIKAEIIKFHKQCIQKMEEIKSSLSSSSTLNTSAHRIQCDESMNVSELMHDIFERLCFLLDCNQKFIAHQNELHKQMKRESAKILSSMEQNNVKNEKERDEEIEKLIKQTRINLERQYGEYHIVCDEKVERMKGECAEYKEKIMSEAKEQIEEKKKNIETIKALIRARYEEEINKIKKMHTAKNEKMTKEIQSLHVALKNKDKTHEQNVYEHMANCKKEFAQKIKQKENEIKERMNVIKMRYDLKMDELVRANDKKIKIERAKCKTQQKLMQNEMESMKADFKKEMLILKRCRPHSIVHVPINSSQQSNKNGSSYSSQLQQYITANQ